MFSNMKKMPIDKRSLCKPIIFRVNWGVGSRFTHMKNMSINKKVSV